MRVLALVTAGLLASGLSVAGCGAQSVTPLPSPVTQLPDTESATAPPGAAQPSGLTVPDVVGKRLVDATQLLSAAGYPKVEQVDASGQDRPILEPVNWIVQAQDPPAGSPAAPGTSITLQVIKPTDGASSAQSVDGVVPAVVCKDLQGAQDALQAAGFFNLWSEDATGQGRQQVVDRNWVVVSQSIAPGERPEQETRITLGVVKFGEPTGDSGCPS